MQQDCKQAEQAQTKLLLAGSTHAYHSVSSYKQRNVLRLNIPTFTERDN